MSFQKKIPPMEADRTEKLHSSSSKVSLIIYQFKQNWHVLCGIWAGPDIIVHESPTMEWDLQQETNKICT